MRKQEKNPAETNKRKGGILRAFGRHKRGSIAIQFGLLVIPFIGLVALGVDGSRALLARYQLQAAVDSSALAVGATIADETKLTAMMDALVRQNFAVSGAQVSTVELKGAGLNVHVVSSANVDMHFASVLGINNLSVEASTEVRRASGGLLVSMALDNTGSMWGSNNIGALREATTTLLDELFGVSKTPSDLRVALVPYASTVNVGDEYTTLIDMEELEDVYEDNLDTFPSSNRRSDTMKDRWKGCVLEREDYSVADVAPDQDDEDTLWKPFWYPAAVDNDYDPKKSSTIKPGGAKNTNQITGPNVGCPTPITPLTNSYDTLNKAAKALTAWNRGGTLTDIGVAWARRTLSPGLPFDESTELDPRDNKTLWSSPRWRKAVIIMTDGESVFYDFPGGGSPNKKHPGKSDYTGYGRLGEDLSDEIFDDEDNNNKARDKVNARIATMCTEMKAEGILMYTVVFTSRVNNTTKNMYKTCATDPGKYFYAPNKNSLKTAFGAIGSDLAKLRIVK